MILKKHFFFYTDGISWITDGWWHLQAVQIFALQLTNQVRIQFTSSNSAPNSTCGSFLHTIQQVSDTSWVPYSSTRFWHDLTGNSIRLGRWRLPSISKVSCKSRLSLVPLTTDYKSEDPMTPSLGLVNLLEWFTELGFLLSKNLLTKLQIYYKGSKCPNQQPDEELHGWGPEEKNLSSHGAWV